MNTFKKRGKNLTAYDNKNNKLPVLITEYDDEEGKRYLPQLYYYNYNNYTSFVKTKILTFYTSRPQP